MSKSTVTVELMILSPVYDAANARARMQARQLSRVAERVVLAAGNLAEPNEDAGYPAPRLPGKPTTRVRFTIDRAKYQHAKERIRASGRTVSAALEDGLERYARTGQF